MYVSPWACTNEENLETITGQRQGCQGRGQGSARGLPSISSMVTKPILPMRMACAKAPMTQARAGWCCVTPNGWHHAARKSGRSVRDGREDHSGSHLGIHAHNDTEQAVGQFAGRYRSWRLPNPGHAQRIGERCGNANLISIIGTLGLSHIMPRLRNRRQA